MKLIKNAFTLAEVLVVLAILGVVAALTMPTLQMDANKATVGPSLAKAISTLENANELLLVDTNARSLWDRCGNETNDYIACLLSNGYIKVSRNGDFNGNYTEYSGTALNLSNIILDSSYVGSDNIEYIAVKDDLGFNTAIQSNLPSEYSGQCYVLYVDINGNKKGPNTLGKDLFRLFVDGKGSVIPDGGSKAITYFGSVNVNQGCNRNGVTDGGYSCAGSIVDNGYRVVYPY